MRLGDCGGAGEGVSERSEAVPTAPPNPLNLPNTQTTLNSPANTIAAYIIPIITLTIAKLIIFAIV